MRLVEADVKMMAERDKEADAHLDSIRYWV